MNKQFQLIKSITVVLIIWIQWIPLIIIILIILIIQIIRKKKDFRWLNNKHKSFNYLIHKNTCLLILIVHKFKKLIEVIKNNKMLFLLI